MEAARLRRHEQRGKYDVDSIEAVFADTFFSHVSYVDEGLPQCLPMIALFRRVGETQDPVIYLHGHPSSRLMEIVRANESEQTGLNGEELKGNPDTRIRVCITATKVDGLVLSSAPNGHTYNYRSGVIHGACSLEKDREMKRDVMKGVTNHIVEGRWEDVNPVASFQVALVCVIRVDVLKGGVKFRAGVPGIQPRDITKDGPDNEVPPWTGVIPLREQLDEPIPSGLTDDAKVPEGLLRFIETRNKAQMQHAHAVAK
ncbi:hypothetical protein LTR10_021297 [Elasticomyces elasticus]|uniref:Flavin-nucleotide-binding protein n=1 Tax=Exophiala sideris TaxID=1016849 RepID=A0ABR0JFU7_9EURO|nr:hypothetical protein LTR10_021297 [Elasticomyces elasticus]KAK5025317.1 hypothetical protein LTS07_008168 [Exophiala sideris]KAK5029136.1 hypothetical protein LTR13_008673 [Exophiala sideris]KAK5063377.1 hypothetical protein LTR69_004083 [Exophiala sideris]KAK5179092.1 hypothetical protein LTR44_008581 [Eurotiomycetes sp. CCFEE 6388]